MSKKDTTKNEIRATLIANSNIRPVMQFPGIIRTMSAKDSLQAAIAARLAEFQCKRK